MKRMNGQNKGIGKAAQQGWIAVFAVCLLALSCFLAAIVARAPTSVMITAKEGSGAVTFRGASVNQQWSNPQSIVASQKGWTFDPAASTYTANGDQALEIKLPVGEKRTLVFNVGPDEGTAIVEFGDERLEINLYSENALEYGKSFRVPGMEPVGVNWYILPMVILVVFQALLLFVNANGGAAYAGRRSRGIEIYRFLFSIVIMLHHIGWQFSFNLFSAGYLAVDLFFIVSGYFMAAHFEQKQLSAPRGGGSYSGEEALRYAASRWKRMFLHHTWSFCVAAIVAVVVLKERSWRQIAFDNWPEFLMLEETGIGNVSVLNGVGWYCSALILSSFCAYYLLNRNKKTYLCVITPISCVLAFSYFYNTYGNLNRYLQNPLLICDGVIRGFAEVSIGCACYYVVRRIKNSRFVVSKGTDPWLFGIVEIGSFSGLLCTMWRSEGYKPGSFIPQDFISIPLMILLVISVLSEKSLLQKIWDKFPAEFLGKLSFSVFLNHTAILGLMTKYMIGRPALMILVVYFGITMGYSILTMQLTDRIEGHHRIKG